MVFKDYNSFGINVVQLNVMKLMAGWVVSKITHTECRTNLSVDTNISTGPTDELLQLRSMKNSNICIPSLFAFQLTVNITQYFNFKFRETLKANRLLLRTRISQKIIYIEEYQKHICNACFNIFKEKLLNSLVNNEVKRRNDKEQKHRKPVEKLKNLNVKT